MAGACSAVANDAEGQRAALSAWLSALSLSYLAAAYEVGVRQTDAYLGPAVGPARWLSLSALGVGLGGGALLGRRLLVRAARRGELLVRASVLLSAACSGSAFAWFWAFQTPIAFVPVALCVPCAVGLAAGFSLGALASACAVSFRELQLLKLVLSPMPALLALGLLLVASVGLSYLGLLRAAPALGLLIAGLASLTPRFHEYLSDAEAPSTAPATVALMFGALAFGAAQSLVPARLLAGYPSEIVWANVQRPELVVISAQNTFELFEAGQLRLTSADSYRYAESLVHPLLSSTGPRRRVLVLGASAGFVEREVLRYPEVQELVSVSELSTSSWARSLWPGAATGDALADPRLRMVHAEVLPWLEQSGRTFDRILVSLPGPGTHLEGKHYTRYFYERVAQHLAEAGALSVQATSQAALPATFASIRASLVAAGLTTVAYEAPVPLLGALSFLIASKSGATFRIATERIPQGLRYLDAAAIARGLSLGARTGAAAKASTLDQQSVVETWHREQEALGH